MPDEFDDALCHTPVHRAGTSARHRLAAARLVSRVYRAASAPLRADMLACLLRPLGTLSLVAVASGAFARLLQRNGAAPDSVPIEDITQYSSEQVLELAAFVHEGHPEALQQLAGLLADHPMGVTALSASALTLLYRQWRMEPTAPARAGRGVRSPAPD